MTTRLLQLVTAAHYEPRTVTHDGAQFIVVPVVALTEGVLYASNAPHPELVTAEEVTKNVEQWIGTPIYMGHPQENGKAVSGRRMDILEKAIGIVKKASADGKKLKMEAWLGVDEMKEHAPALLDRLMAKEPVQVSVGVTVDTYEKRGIKFGKTYGGVWQNLGADHLAILPEETPGACDWNMGCGIRAAEGTIVEDHMYSQWLEPGPETDELLRTLDNYSEADRKKIPAEDFAGKNRSFPIVKPGDVQNAAISIGRAGSDNYSPDQLKRRIIAIAYRKGAAFVAQLPDSWKKKKDMKNASVFAKIMDMLRVAAGTETVDAEETAELVAYEAIEAQINGAMGALQAAGDLCADLIADEQENPTETPAEEDAEEMVEDARLKAIIAYLGTAQAGCQSAATLCYAECADKVDPVETASTPRYYSEKAAWGEEKKPCQCKKNLSAKSAGM